MVFFFFFAFSSSLEELSDDEDDEDEEDDEEDDEELETSTFFRGLAFKKARKSSVKFPKPIEVKKLMENRVLAGSSLGKRPSKAV